ncbi:unnamed protein product [Caenorhabditis bovis]|uniref:Uncharacterized protein n=1 Tax=Caenorhabditis bovis TaxID=2654633 RepID=A0A8S1FBC9_9PELO|nr:unnamed protein product [Caenorhabditis bovis]
MKHSSRSNKDYSPSRRRHDSRDRNKRDKYQSSSRSKDYSSDIAKMKDKMRTGLESARSYQYEPETSSSKVKIEDEIDHVERARIIQQIEENGFQPANFKTSSGSRKYADKKKEKESNSETNHDAAMFGPAWKSKEQLKKIDKKIKEEVNLDDVELPEANMKKLSTNAPMVPDHVTYDILFKTTFF